MWTYNAPFTFVDIAQDSCQSVQLICNVCVEYFTIVYHWWARNGSRNWVMQVFSQEVQLWLPGAQLLCPWSQSQLCQSCPEPSPQPLQCTQYSVISLILSIFSHMHVFGGTERDSEKSFMVEVPQRNVATLLYSNTYFKYSNPITYRRMMFLGVSLVMQNWINHLQWWMEGIPDPSQSWIHTQDCDPQPVVCGSTPQAHTPRQWRGCGEGVRQW
jgi:hypothetical protein